MKYWTLGHRLPTIISTPLFGDRKNYGMLFREDDEDWMLWQRFYLDFYNKMQKQGVGKKVNDAGYQVLKNINLTGLDVMEIGPGIMPHINFWRGKPRCYTIVDISEDMLNASEEVLQIHKIKTIKYLSTNERFDFENNTFDVIISFFNLEHLYPLELYLKEFQRILRPGGILVGAIPCEGGIGWGLGRLLTSRKFVMKNTNINYDKIICWEHPNFAEYILSQCDFFFSQSLKQYWPFSYMPVIDLNLVVKFIYKK